MRLARSFGNDFERDVQVDGTFWVFGNDSSLGLGIESEQSSDCFGNLNIRENSDQQTCWRSMWSVAIPTRVFSSDNDGQIKPKLSSSWQVEMEKRLQASHKRLRASMESIIEKVHPANSFWQRYLPIPSFHLTKVFPYFRYCWCSRPGHSGGRRRLWFLCNLIFSYQQEPLNEWLHPKKFLLQSIKVQSIQLLPNP